MNSDYNGVVVLRVSEAYGADKCVAHDAWHQMPVVKYTRQMYY